MDKKTVLITGCSSGFGKLAAKTFYDRGWNVVATMRSPGKESDLTGLDGVLVVKLDVTDTASIGGAVAEAVSRFEVIDVLVNNAGYGGNAVFEQMDDAAVRRMYETNVFGLMNVTRAVLPAMRRRKEGRVINVTSMAGVIGFPTASVYVSSKHAVEGLTEALALEYRPLNILFKSVMPGSYPTTRFNANVDDESDVGDEQLTSYAATLAAQIQAVAENMAMQGGEQSDPQEVADLIYECATGDTPVHNPIGADAQMIMEMMNSAPREAFLDQLAEMVLPPQTPNA